MSDPSPSERSDSRRWRILHDVTKEINASLDLNVVLDTILHEGLAAAGARLGWISVVRSERGEKWLEMVAARGFDPWEGPGRGLFEFGSGLTGTAAQTGKAYYAPDISKEKSYVEILPEIRSELVVPLVAHGEVTGVLNAESPRIDGFCEEDRALLEALAESAALAITNAQRHTEISDSLRRSAIALEHRARDMAALARVSSAVNSSTELDEVLRLIIETAKLVARAPHCQLLLVDDMTGELVMHTQFELLDGSAEGSRRSLEEGITGWVAKHREPLAIPDVTQDARYVKWIDGTRSEVAVPLLSGGELVGVLNLESPALANFGAEHIELLEILAHHAVVAIENARLFEELREAQQRALVAERLSAVGEVSGDIIHWVGNRAGLIPGIVSSIRAEIKDLPESVAEDLEVIERNAGEILKLKRTLLGTPADEDPESLSLSAAIREAAERAVGNGIEVAVDIPREADRVIAAPRALGRAISVIVGNAVEAMRGRGRIEVTASRMPDSARVVLSVADSGPGIPPEMRRRVFNPFFTTKRDSGGTGMGLWLAYRAMARMGGELSLAEGEGAGAGAVFRLTLPAAGL